MSKHTAICKRLGPLMALLLMAVFACLTPMTAQADDSTGELLVLPTDANSGVEYGVYGIFTGQMAENGALYNVEWVNDEVSQAVRSAIQSEDPTYDPTLAQRSAEFIINAFGDTELGVTVVDSSSFASKLAMAIYNAHAPHSNLEASQAGSFPPGYYLIMTDPDSFDDVDNESGTSPIFAMVSAGKRVQVGEKTDSPSIILQVMEADTGKWGKRTVSGTNEDDEFMATVTLPSNYASFSSYKLEITDKIENMELRSVEDIHLYVDGNEVTPAIDYNGTDTFKTTIDDLKQVAPDATKDTVITLKYIAHLIPGANMGANGNASTVRLRYTRSPNSADLGSVPISSVAVYSWGLKIMKIESKKPETLLPGAEFTVGFVRKTDTKDAVPATSEYEGYVSSDGSIVSQPYTFVTDKEGLATMPNIPAGTYIISETKAPDGYDGIKNDFALILVNKWDEGSTSGPYDLEATIVGNDEHVTMDAEGSANIGTVSATVQNDKVIPPTQTIPLIPTEVQRNVAGAMNDIVNTGRGRVILGSVIGLVALGAFGGYAWLRHKGKDRKAEESKE